jgi:hypothetical protein
LAGKSPARQNLPPSVNKTLTASAIAAALLARA